VTHSSFNPDFGGGTASEQSLNDVFGLDAFGLRMEIRQDAMPEHGIGQRLNIFDGTL
jgi:hypothetical protein